MRLISIDRIEKNMTLGKTLHDVRGNVLLPAGSDLWPFLAQLKNFKIQFLYVNDEISKDIEAYSILRLETRQALPELMRTAEKEMASKRIAFEKISSMIADDIYDQPELRLDVTELITNGLYRYRHELNVAIVAGLIGRMLNMTSVEIKGLCMGGMFHDIGRLALPDEIMAKVAAGEELTAVETEQFKKYPSLGYDMIKNDNSLPIATKAAVLQHMERIDGKGFPLRKSGEKIMPAGKILAIANMFDELFSGTNMEYGQAPMRIYEVVEYIQNHAGTAFDAELAEEFAKHAIVFPNGTVVKLSNGKKGIVINQNPDFIARPIIKITQSADGTPDLGLVNMMEDLSLIVEDIEV